MSRRIAPAVWIAAALLGMTAFLTIVTEGLVVTGLSTYPTASAALADATDGLTAMTYGIVGALILSRRANAVGAILLAFGLLGAALGASSSYSSHLFLPSSPANDARQFSALVALGWSAVVSGLAWLGAVTLVALLVQLFPDGRPLSSRWRLLLWLTLLWPLLFVCVNEFSPLTDATGQAVNPHGVTGPLADVLVGARTALSGIVALIILGSVASTILRFRRARGRQRAQLKWFAYGAVAAVVGFSFNGPFGTAGYALNGIAFSVIPLCIGIAILRHRLYDIDLLIRRSVSYAATSATVGVAFFAAIVVLETLLWPLTGGSEAAIAVSTLIGVAIFQPVRRRIQRAVDRRFDRSNYDAAGTLDRFSNRLGTEVDLDALRAELLGVVGETMTPAHASLWLRPPSRSAATIDAARGTMS